VLDAAVIFIVTTVVEIEVKWNRQGSSESDQNFEQVIGERLCHVCHYIYTAPHFGLHIS
jgi:hypothetical protein